MYLLAAISTYNCKLASTREHCTHLMTHVSCCRLFVDVCDADSWNGFNTSVDWFDPICLVYRSCKYQLNTILC